MFQFGQPNNGQTQPAATTPATDNGGTANAPATQTQPAPAAPAAPAAMVPVAQPQAGAMVEVPPEFSAAIEALRGSGLDFAELAGAQDDAMEHLTGSAIRMKRIEYARTKKSQELGLVPGKITDVQTGEQRDILRARPLTLRRWRRIRPPWDMNSTEVEPSICVSLDGVHRSGGTGVGVAKVGDDKVDISVPVPVGGLCMQCPYSKWVNGRMTCSEHYTLLALDRDEMNTPFVTTFKGVGIKAFRAAMGSMEIAGMKAGWNPGMRPLAKQAFSTFTMKAVPKSTWYEPVFGDIEGVPDVLATMVETANYAPTMALFLSMDLDGITMADVGEGGDAAETGDATRVVDQDGYDAGPEPEPRGRATVVQPAAQPAPAPAAPPPGASVGQFGRRK